MRDYPYESIMAARVLGQGYAYLLTAMRHRGERLGLALSALVDIGVHSGLFLHHVPRSTSRTTARCCGRRT